jgi:predicted 3-demethylubiquinone-9 3-methyltransferase (glyoxalase superfamily)
MELTTCLWFNGRAREAATFYVSIFPDSSVADNWIAPTETPGNAQGEEVLVNFRIFGQPFIGLNGGPQFPHSEAISFQIPCANQAEIDKYLGGSDPEGAQRATQAMLEMKKIDLAAMEKAYLGK